MSGEERMRVLRMVSEGTLTAEEANGLLSALEIPAGHATRVIPTMPPPRPPTPDAPQSRSKLVIDIQENDEKQVHVCIPLSLARAATRLIPKDAQRFLNEAEINIDELLDGLAGVDTDGVLVSIQDDDTRVVIRVE